MKAQKGSSAGSPVMAEDAADDHGGNRPAVSVPLEEHHDAPATTKAKGSYA